MIDAAQFAQARILNQPVYTPGKPISHVAREFGLDPAGIDKLASNENPLGPSPKGLAAAREALADMHLYPDGSAWELTGKLAVRLGLGRDQILLGNGSNEVLEIDLGLVEGEFRVLGDDIADDGLHRRGSRWLRRGFGSRGSSEHEEPDKRADSE